MPSSSSQPTAELPLPRSRSEPASTVLDSQANLLQSPAVDAVSGAGPVSPQANPGLNADCKSIQRQQLLSDSVSKRQQTCKAALTAARQDVLKWLSTQKVVSSYLHSHMCLPIGHIAQRHYSKPYIESDISQTKPV